METREGNKLKIVQIIGPFEGNVVMGLANDGSLWSWAGPAVGWMCEDEGFLEHTENKEQTALNITFK